MSRLKVCCKHKEERTNGSFADFFLHVSEEEKKRVFTEAARRANEDQRALIESIEKLEHRAT